MGPSKTVRLTPVFFAVVCFLLVLTWRFQTRKVVCPPEAQDDSETDELDTLLRPIKYSYKMWTPFFNRPGYDLNTKDLPRILFWTTVDGAWHSGLRDENIEELEYEPCPERCYIANDRRLLYSSDAVVFYGNDVSGDDLPKMRAPCQKWVYWSLDSPKPSKIKGFENLFNWTMTYRSDSDIVYNQGSVLKESSGREYSKSALEHTWRGKSKMAAWAPKKCQTTGGREKFVKELQNHMTVDVYGECGNNTCVDDLEHSCYKRFEKEHFFFFAFESAICKDFVSESFYTALLFDVIPVVFGGADYDAVAPAGSYIDALKFKTRKDLADHLKEVAEDFTMYSRYFDWKRHYQVRTRTKHNFCELCRRLHQETFDKPTTYRSISHWWNDMSKCRTWHEGGHITAAT